MEDALARDFMFSARREPGLAPVPERAPSKGTGGDQPWRKLRRRPANVTGTDPHRLLSPDSRHRDRGFGGIFGFSLSSRAYTVLVRSLRWVLPMTAIGVAALVFAWPRLNQISLPAGGGEFTAESVRLNTVSAPRYMAHDSQGRPFMITAEEASQLPGDSGRIRLNGATADMTLENDGWVALQASRGEYDTKGETLHLTNNVRLFHDKGYEISAPSLSVDIKKGVAWTDQPLKAQGPVGTLQAKGGVRVENTGRKVVFRGPVRLTLFPGAMQQSGS